MTGELYNELFKDFQNLQNFKDSSLAESEQITIVFNNAIETGDFEKLVTLKNPFVWYGEYLQMVENLMVKFETIDPNYTKKYRNSKLLNPDVNAKYPEVFTLFKKLVDSVKEEDYIESSRLKNKILSKY